MTYYMLMCELYPEYSEVGLEAMVRDDIACPAKHSAELFGYDRLCEAPQRTRGVCRECQRRFLKAEADSRSGRRKGNAEQ